MKNQNQSQEDQEDQALRPNKHISFSELKKWTSCPFAHSLAYEQRIRLFTGNTYTAFGTALHETLEALHETNALIEDSQPAQALFVKNLEKAIATLDNESIDQKLLKDMPTQGSRIIDEFVQRLPLREMFGDFEVVSLEEEIYEPIPEDVTPSDQEYNFKGFIDMVIKTGETYHIIDWKSCTWGWNARKKSDPMNVYQLTLYKKFFAQKHNVDPENIKTYFGLLKRTPLKDNIEVFEVTNGKKRTQNAVQLLSKALSNIQSGLKLKNRLSCKYCEFYKTEHCK